MNRLNCSVSWSVGGARVTAPAEHVFVILKPRTALHVTMFHEPDAEIAQDILREVSLVYLKPGQRLEMSGQYETKIISADAVCLLAAFVDAALESAQSHDPAQLHPYRPEVTPPPGFKPIDLAHCRSDRDFERFVISDLLAGRSQVVGAVRRSEAYLLMRFLIQAEGSSETLQQMCHTYGLSYSYFRKKCRAVLGAPVKTRLCEWRTARAVLDIIAGKRGSILDIALENGFASASHISREFKSRLGISPSTFAKPGQLWRTLGACGAGAE